MTTLVVCAVRDSAMDAFMQPFFVQNKGVAIRAFTDEVNKQDSPMNQHPEDYELFTIGVYHDDTGSIEPNRPVAVVRATDVLKPLQ